MHVQVSTLPDNISYSTLTVSDKNVVKIPRRELYDVRMQLMAEDEDLPDSAPPSSVPSSVTCEGRRMKEREVMLDFVNGHEDVRPGIYEGGLKSWECSIDLVRWLARQLDLNNIAQGSPRVLELGCGTSLPSLFLFQEAVRMSHDGAGRDRDVNRGGATFHLADYNYEVLRLVTMPNVFLSWVLCARPEILSLPSGDIGVTEDLKATFLTSLHGMNVQLGFISGCWGDEMLSLLDPQRIGYNIVLGSETIYEPSTAGEFTKVLVECLDARGVGLVAAKKLYFGVGGSMEAFAHSVRAREGWAVKEVEHIGREGGGVGGVIVEVKREEGPDRDTNTN